MTHEANPSGRLCAYSLYVHMLHIPYRGIYFSYCLRNRFDKPFFQAPKNNLFLSPGRV